MYTKFNFKRIRHNFYCDFVINKYPTEGKGCPPSQKMLEF